jgi:redox-sensitive bicupin YhaK (pirin superfamily)
MTAGRGVVHSERRPEELRDRVHLNHGLQLWAALPAKDEEVEPAFTFIHRVPEDISVIGYDDTLLAAFVPPLTTVHQNWAKMADCWHASRWTCSMETKQSPKCSAIVC